MQIRKCAKRIGQVESIECDQQTNRGGVEGEWESRETAVRPEDWGRSGCNVAPVFTVFTAGPIGTSEG